MLLGNTKTKINKDEDGENLSHLEINEVALFYCHIANNNYQHDSWALCLSVHNKLFSQLWNVTQKFYIFKNI